MACLVIGGLTWHHLATMMHPDTIQQLRDFRNELYMLFGKRADALFELGDVAITAGLSPSMAYLSLEAAHRRGWGSPSMLLWPRGRSTLRVSSRCWRAIPWPTGSLSMPSMSLPGRDAMPKRALIEASTITPPATRPASPLWRDGPIS